MAVLMREPSIEMQPISVSPRRDPEEKAIALAKGPLLIYKRDEVETKFLRHGQPFVPWSHLPVYVVLLLTVSLLEHTDYHYFDSQEKWGYVAFLVASFLFLMAFFSLLHLYLCVFDRKSTDTKPRSSNFLMLSDGMLVATAIAVTIAEYHILYFDHIPKRCSNVNFVYRSRWGGPEYDRTNCVYWMAPFTPTIGLLLVLVRQRLAHIMLVNVVVAAHNAVFLLFVGDGSAGHGWTGMMLLYVGGFLSFGCAVRWVLEAGERARFESHVELEEYGEALQQRGQELDQLVKSLVPAPVVARSAASGNSGRSIRKADYNDKAMFLVVGVHNFYSRYQFAMPDQVTTYLESMHTFVEEACSRVHLHRVRILEDEICVVGNLIGTDRHATKPLASSAVSAAFSFVSQSSLEFPLHAALHVGEAFGTFHGGGWVRYDVSGEGLRVALEALSTTGAQQVIATEEVVNLLAGSGAELERGPTLESSAALSVVTVPPQAPTLPIATDTAIVIAPGTMHDDAESIYSRCSSSPTGSNSPFDSSRTSQDLMESVALLISDSRAPIEKGRIHMRGAGNAKYSTKTVWWLFMVFEDASTEEAFLADSARWKMQRASWTWDAFVGLQFVLLGLYLSDRHVADSLRIAPLVLFLLSAGASLGIALVPKKFSEQQMARWHTVWSATSVVVPLILVAASAMARPSAVGNDPRPLTIVSAIVRSTCFLHARWQLIALPFFGILSQFQAVLPGGYWDVAHLFFLFLVGYCVLIDRDNDSAERRTFVTKAMIEQAIKLLEEEQQVRRGLLRATLPSPVFHLWARGSLQTGTNLLHVVPNTVLVLLTYRFPTPEPSVGGSSTSRSKSAVALPLRGMARIEAAVAALEHLTLLKVFGDTALIAGPIAGSSAEGAALSDDHIAHVLCKLTQLTESERFSAFVDVDASKQVISHTSSGLPKFSIHGPMVWRAFALHDAGAIGTGLNVTDRVKALASECHASGKLVVMLQEYQMRMRVRGVGLMRLVKLETAVDDGYELSSSCSEE